MVEPDEVEVEDLGCISKLEDLPVLKTIADSLSVLPSSDEYCGFKVDGTIPKFGGLDVDLYGPPLV